MLGRYEIQISLIEAQESLYRIKYSFEQLRNLNTDFSAVFIVRVNIRILVGNIRNWMLHSNASLYRGRTCFKKLLRHYTICKSWSAKFPLVGAEPSLAIGLLHEFHKKKKKKKR